MKRIMTALLAVTVLFALTACDSSNTDKEAANTGTQQNSSTPEITHSEAPVIEKGNTEIIAEMIAEQTGGDGYPLPGGLPGMYQCCSAGTTGECPPGADSSSRQF